MDDGNVVVTHGEGYVAPVSEAEKEAERKDKIAHGISTSGDSDITKTDVKDQKPAGSIPPAEKK